MASIFPQFLRRCASTSPSTLSKTSFACASSKLCFSTSSKLRDEEEAEINRSDRSDNGVRVDARFHNHVTLMGRVARTPKTVGEGTRAVTFCTVVTKRFYEYDGDIREDPHFHNILVTNKTPNVHNYVKSRVQKGDRVYLEGSLSYTMKQTQDGKTKKEPTIHVDDFITVASAY